MAIRHCPLTFTRTITRLGRPLNGVSPRPPRRLKRGGASGDGTVTKREGDAEKLLVRRGFLSERIHETGADRFFDE
jgi:hypothetical protein